MSGLLSLPFEIHLQIALLLSLRDCIAYMQVCTTTHDIIYYIFAHRKELNFQSVLDTNQTIALPPRLLMKILYAHSRVESILNFCLHPSFTLLNEFSRYFHLYWSYKLVEVDQHSATPIPVGHPSDFLNSISYLGNYGGSHVNKHSSRSTCGPKTKSGWNT